jgi:glucose-6-phosphate 1-dehydrogenase
LSRNASQINDPAPEEAPLLVANQHDAKAQHLLEKTLMNEKALSIIVFGASGDLAKKKTYPALFSLFCRGLLPAETLHIAGYARRDIALDVFRQQISQYFPEHPKKAEFLNLCSYHRGQYDSAEDVKKMATGLLAVENKCSCLESGANRVFYLAIPPSVFVAASSSIKHGGFTSSGWNRVIVEKPFGHDLESSNALADSLSKLFTEEQIYRIDHYLAKEMVQNLMVLRFANSIYEPIWNRKYIKSVKITFKENFGTKGRGGYFDKVGIVRDVMQNHLLQILSLVAMEAPASLDAEDVRNEKVKVLRQCSPIDIDDVVLGQYTADPNGGEVGYTDDTKVPEDSRTPTFAQAIIRINNERWAGVPFIMKAGKALEERKAEIRIQFYPPYNNLFGDISPNELVMRVQPDESIYIKTTTKRPGIASGLSHTELDLTYAEKDPDGDIPQAYERLIYDVVRGDHNLFVRVDELEAAWKMFTPLLKAIETRKDKPVHKYAFGSRGPRAADQQFMKYYTRTMGYKWVEKKTSNAMKPPSHL